ncbi:hypothetical protein FB451DRAFT_1305133 [Mycena latifolia]|nr:hypothetical protein FB451DRAFT_1305133 [Mycena latifolia]
MSSPSISQQRTHYCPNGEDVAEFQTLLVRPTLRMQPLDDDIAGLPIRAYMDAHTTLISPVQRVPLEITQEIFAACLPEHRSCIMNTREAPILLGCICSSWRTISLSTPRLWSKLHIVQPAYSIYHPLPLFQDQLARRLAGTKIWLSRSALCPLTISLKCAFHGTALNESATQILQALLPFASRWENITFTTYAASLETMSHLTEADVPMLKSFSIHTPAEAIVPWHALGFLSAAAIHSFHVTGGTGFNRALELPLRWSHLAHLSINEEGWKSESTLTSKVALRMLSRCPQLRCCRLIVHFAPDAHGAVEEPILKLSFLHTLDLEFVGTLPSTVRHLFSRLTPTIAEFKTLWSIV